MTNARTATAADFDKAAQSHAYATWFWGIVTVLVAYFFHWWAIIPVVLTLLSIVKSVSSTKCAIAFRIGTYSIPNPNNGAPNGDEIIVMPGTYTSTAVEVVNMRGGDFPNPLLM